MFGGSGNGEQIAANKVPGVRAATAHDLLTVRGSVENYDAQILCMAGEQRMSPLVCPGWARAKRITAVPPAEAPRTKYTLDFQVVEQLDQRLHLVHLQVIHDDGVGGAARGGDQLGNFVEGCRRQSVPARGG